MEYKTVAIKRASSGQQRFSASFNDLEITWKKAKKYTLKRYITGRIIWSYIKEDNKSLHSKGKFPEE